MHALQGEGMAKEKAAERDWEKFWATIWFNLFHALGIVAVIAIVAAIAWGILGPSDTDKSTPEKRLASHCTANPAENEAKQILTNLNLLKNARPCVRKVNDELDLSSCTLFGLSPGMSYAQVAATIDHSGYFPCETVLIDRRASGDASSNKPTATHFKDGFHVSVEFAGDVNTDRMALKATGITLIIGPGSNPYFDPESMRPVMKKLFGQPSYSNDNSDEWRSSARHIRAYSYNQQYWILFYQNE